MEPGGSVQQHHIVLLPLFDFLLKALYPFVLRLDLGVTLLACRFQVCDSLSHRPQKQNGCPRDLSDGFSPKFLNFGIFFPLFQSIFYDDYQQRCKSAYECRQDDF